MPDEVARRWVVEPAGAGEISLRMALGDGVELTPEQEVASGALIRSLERSDADVAGFSNTGNTPSSCGDSSGALRCSKLNCSCERLYGSAPAGSTPGWSLMGSFGSSA